MKKLELRNFIRECIREVLNEAPNRPKTQLAWTNINANDVNGVNTRARKQSRAILKRHNWNSNQAIQWFKNTHEKNLPPNGQISKSWYDLMLRTLSTEKKPVKGVKKESIVNEAPANPKFEKRAAEFLALLNKKAIAHWKKTYPDTPANKFSFEFDRGSKYWRIVRITAGGVSRSAYGFLNTQTGDVLMSAGWKAPAKGARGNIYSSDVGMGATGPYGIKYVKLGSSPWVESVKNEASKPAKKSAPTAPRSWKVCDFCHDRKSDVTSRLDPLEEIQSNMCNDCYLDREEAV